MKIEPVTFGSARSWLWGQIAAVLFVLGVGALLFSLALHGAIRLGGTSYALFGTGAAVGFAFYPSILARGWWKARSTLVIHDAVELSAAQKKTRATLWKLIIVAVIAAQLVQVLSERVQVFIYGIAGGASITIGLLMVCQLRRHRRELERLAREVGSIRPGK
jgi:Na+-transporting NADH:ubiquinone oxidoreductase subunit NqrD